MKNLLPLVIATTALGSLSVSAQERDTSKDWVAGYGLYYDVDGDKPAPTGGLDDGFGLGIEGGFRFTSNWAARLEYTYLNLDANAAGIDDSGHMFGLDALYFLDNTSLYLFGGLRHESLDDTYRMAAIGAGKHWDLNDKWKLVTEAGYMYDFGQSYSDYTFKLGLAYYYGSTPTSQPKPMPVAPIGDSDGDGVNDNLDRCPATPAGTRVDSQGCNIDKDGDGVINANDQCPNTPKGTEVNNVGCAIIGDSDQDGVADNLDACPETPLGDEVHADGCTVFKEKEVTQSLRILFDNNSTVVKNPDSTELEEFANFMKRYGKTNAVIEGHTSAPGKATYNMDLSKRRAEAVVEVLVKHYGIDAERLAAVGFGESRLLDSSNTAEAHKVNRRIEVTVSETVEVPVRD